jgi:hypothetical protein
MSARELHHRLVAVIERVAVRAVPPEDTLVSWFRGPILYTTVPRSQNQVRSSLIRNDSVAGTAEGTWESGGLQAVDLLWTRGDSTTVRFQAVARSGIRGAPSEGRLQLAGARAGLRIEWLEGSMTRSLARRCAWWALAPATEAQVR